MCFSFPSARINSAYLQIQEPDFLHAAIYKNMQEPGRKITCFSQHKSNKLFPGKSAALIGRTVNLLSLLRFGFIFYCLLSISFVFAAGIKCSFSPGTFKFPAFTVRSPGIQLQRVMFYATSRSLKRGRKQRPNSACLDEVFFIPYSHHSCRLLAAEGCCYGGVSVLY